MSNVNGPAYVEISADKQTSKNAPRPPVVVVLGHVDHGKTSILDYIRKAKVVEKEAGGITQHVGAYQVEHTPSDSDEVKKITFIDTPGHEAFSAIRSRGAKIADTAILVVAADEGVKPQTKESISVLKDNGTPFIVVLNKIDSPRANGQAVRQSLAENDVLVEDYGGSVPVVEVSAKTGKGIDELLDMILLVAELEELKADAEGQASGAVIEVHLDKQRGIVATLIVREGELGVGDWVAAGTATARVKIMEDFVGKRIGVAVASQPAVILGWQSEPRVGQEFKSYQTQTEAGRAALAAMKEGRTELFKVETGPEKSNKKTANFIIKADTHSSLEAIEKAMRAVHSEEVDWRVISHGVGPISDNDINNAIAAVSTGPRQRQGMSRGPEHNMAVLGFSVGIDGAAANLAERNGISAGTFNIIYELIEKVRAVMSELLEPEIKRNDLGKIKILAVFKQDARSQVIGGRVTSGKAVRGAAADVIRQGNAVLTGRIGQLQHNKADVAEVAEGLECGIRFDLPKDALQSRPILIKEGDTLEVYEEEKIKRTL